MKFKIIAALAAVAALSACEYKPDITQQQQQMAAKGVGKSTVSHEQ